MNKQESEFNPMNYAEAEAHLRQVIAYNRMAEETGLPKTKYKTSYFSAAPGTGKSALVKSVADEFNLPVVEMFLSEYDPSEVGGFVYRDGDTMRKARPDELPADGRGILLLEEFSDATTAVQNIACRLIRERSLGRHKLGAGWTIIACGNRQKDRSGAQQLVKKFNGRVCMIELEATPEQWVEKAGRLGFDPSVVAYIGRYPASLSKFNPLHEVSPTPRTWEFVSDTVQGMQLPPSVLLKTIAGYIGKGEAGQFIGFLKNMSKLPDIADIVRAPDTVALPDEPDLQYATVSYVSSKATTKTVGPILQYLDRFPNKELVVFAVRFMHSRDKALSSTPAFNTWLTKNSREFLI